VGRLRDAKKAMDKQDQVTRVIRSATTTPVIALLMLVLPAMAFAGNKGDEPEFPVPQNIPHMLFYMQRTPNINTIIYDLNLQEDGTLDESQPVNIYWIRYTENKEKKGLNYIQRKFAYGLKIKQLSKEKYELRSVAYDKKKLYLMKSPEGNYHIYTQIGSVMAVLNRIYLQIEGGTFWFPNVVYVEMKGIDPATGKEIKEQFKP
jgi:hypothetical protein